MRPEEEGHRNRNRAPPRQLTSSSGELIGANLVPTTGRVVGEGLAEGKELRGKELRGKGVREKEWRREWDSNPRCR
jgi:hypothetical protein